MKHLVRVFSILFVAILLTSMLILVPAEAANPSASNDVSLCYIDIGLLTAALSIDGNGKASCDGFVRARTSTNKVYITMILQRSSGNSWEKVKSWSTSGTPSATLAKEWYVVSGYTYRVKVTASAYTSSGSFIEQQTVYSGSESY